MTRLVPVDLGGAFDPHAVLRAVVDSASVDPHEVHFLPLLAAVDVADDWLSAALSDGRRGTLAVAEHDGSWAPDHVNVSAALLDDGSAVLRGEKHYVLGADTADEVIVAARVDGHDDEPVVGLFLVERARLTDVVTGAVAGAPALARVALADLTVEPTRVLSVDGAAPLRRAVDIAATYEAATMVAIASDLRHAGADVVVATLRAEAAVDTAVDALASNGPGFSLAASMAKAAAADLAVAAEATLRWRGDGGPNEAVGRLRASAALWGTGDEHRARVATLIGL